MELYWDIFMECFSLQILYKITDGLGYSSVETNTGQKGLSFLGANIWSKINHSINNVITSPSFMHTLKKNILLHLQTYANLNSNNILMFNIIISFSHSNIVFSCVHQCHFMSFVIYYLSFPFFSHTSKRDPNGNKHLSENFQAVPAI